MLSRIDEPYDNIPDGPNKFEQHIGNLTIQAFKKNRVIFLIGALDFTMKTPPCFRQVEWVHYNEYTELKFFVDPELFDDQVIGFAHVISILI